MDRLFILLALQRQAQEVTSLDALSHIITNETLKIVPYKQAVFWRAEGTSVFIKSVSGNAALDEKSSYALALKKVIKKYAFLQADGGFDNQNIQSFSPEDMAAEGSDFKNHVVLIIFKTAQEGVLGGLWLERDSAFENAELKILSELAVTYSHALVTAKLRDNSVFLETLKRLKKLQLYIFAAVIVALFIPVRLSITAPAEIIAENPVIISTPFEGTLENILVQPGDHVKKGQVIAEMDKINLSAKLDRTSQELDIAKANLSRLSRESLSSPEKKIELKKLEADIAVKNIEYVYALDMMERSDIKAPQDGVAIFADKNILQGKPVRMGQKVMMIADPKESELLIRVPVEAMIPLSSDARVKFFLNVSPLKGRKAKIRSIGYQASQDADGLLTYKIHAHLDEDIKDVRIGWKGTGKIYGERVIFGYALLRRPLASLRELLGV